MTPILIPDDLHQSVISELRNKLAQANQRLKTNYEEPSIEYKPQGTLAGSAHLAAWKIRLNTVLLLENQLTFIQEVIPHELAHLLTFKYLGRVAPHGKAWRWMMSEILNVTPRRTHQFSVTSIARATFLYRCQCQEHPLSKIRHNRMQRQQIRYFCKKCKQLLIYVNE